MTIEQLIPVVFQISMGLIMFCVALRANLRNVGYLIERPGLLVRSLLAMNVIMPLFAVALALLFEFRPALEVAFVALALSPVPPFLPTRQLKAGGAPRYIVGLLTLTSLLSIVFVPAVVGLLGWLLSRSIHVSSSAVARIVILTVLAPLAFAVLVRLLAPSLVERIPRPLTIFAMALLALVCVPVLLAEWRAILALIGDLTLVAMAIFVFAGLAIGHVLGGPNPDDRTVLALSTATRHPAVALAIAHDAPDQRGVLGGVLLMLIVGALASGPYVKWRTRSRTIAGALR
jgi:bile acid:Na+ symporter, BASS family